jgi:outer membrane protein assembly factor BamB
LGISDGFLLTTRFQLARGNSASIANSKKLGSSLDEERSIDSGNSIHNIYDGRCIYFFGKDGDTTVVRPGSVFDRVAVNTLSNEESQAQAKMASQATPENKVSLPPAPPVVLREMEVMVDEAMGEIIYGVAVTNNCFILRSGTALYCIDSAAH